MGGMEHRREPRFEIDQPVSVVNLDLPSAAVAGRITNFSANGTRLIVERELDSGTMVKVEWGTTILLGEIIYCSPQGSEFAVGLKLEDALYERETIAKMCQYWSTEPAQANR
jgi:hypothetical protein